MLKIAVVGTRGFPNVQGGIESHCEHLYTALAKEGNDITVFTRKPYIDPDVHSYKGVILIPVSCPKNRYFETIVHTFKSVLKARKLRPGILHIHAIGPSIFTPLARALGMKVVITNHGPDYKRKKWSLLVKIFLIFSEWIGIIFADEVIAVSDGIANDIHRKFKRDVTVIPNGVEIPSFSETDNSLKKYNLQKKRYILAVGRFVPEKGFNSLIEAFNRMDFAGWKLVIAGQADHKDKYSIDLRERAARNNDIILTGFLTGQPLNELYSHAGLFVLPSYYEGLPIVLLEAMSYGLSCVASDIPANREVELGDDRFFKAGDVRELSGKIKKFIASPLNQENRKKQIDSIAKKYNWDKISSETLKVYRKIIK